MKTITLHYSESIYEKLKNFLDTFSKEDLEVEDTSKFEKIKSQLQRDYDLYKQNPTDVLSVNEAEAEMDLFIKNNEN
ncbi:hypothetical protein [Halpernia frigidisoli]|uniref:Uncharacterized protein n=1 Tax=Halpernia frigidisoli TaxID=1125876 RepID=A0A1I3FVL5_9FLAO|nr:hypothetical protein [Halpernia frigidisoli]SFI15194.1 hypothetical protein SAMN05443292_1656 [Halpernia frigidisoli]